MTPAGPDCPIAVLARGEGWIAALKPEGVATVPEGPGDGDCLRARLERQLGAQLWPVHRLDKEVSGVVLLACSAEMHRRLNDLFAARAFAKTYRAVVHGRVADDAGTIDLPLREAGSGRRAMVDPGRGKPSVTHYRVVARAGAFTGLELQPETGRRHQLRAHLYAIGHPIVGDLRYGDRAQQAAFPRLMLHAAAIACDPPGGPRLALSDVPSASFDAAWHTLLQPTAMDPLQSPC